MDRFCCFSTSVGIFASFASNNWVAAAPAGRVVSRNFCVFSCIRSEHSTTLRQCFVFSFFCVNYEMRSQPNPARGHKPIAQQSCRQENIEVKSMTMRVLCALRLIRSSQRLLSRTYYRLLLRLCRLSTKQTGAQDGHVSPVSNLLKPCDMAPGSN